MPTVTTLTLSSAAKATLFRIILWRCWARYEHGIARLGTDDLQVPGYSASRLKLRQVWSRAAILVPFHCMLTGLAQGRLALTPLRHLDRLPAPLIVGSARPTKRLNSIFQSNKAQNEPFLPCSRRSLAS